MDQICLKRFVSKYLELFKRIRIFISADSTLSSEKPFQIDIPEKYFHK